MKYNHSHLLYMTSESFICQIKCFDQPPSIGPEPPTCYHCRIMDGAVIVFLIATFIDYEENGFIPNL